MEKTYLTCIYFKCLKGKLQMYPLKVVVYDTAHNK